MSFGLPSDGLLPFFRRTAAPPGCELTLAVASGTTARRRTAVPGDDLDTKVREELLRGKTAQRVLELVTKMFSDCRRSPDSAAE